MLGDQRICWCDLKTLLRLILRIISACMKGSFRAAPMTELVIAAADSYLLLSPVGHSVLVIVRSVVGDLRRITVAV